MSREKREIIIVDQKKYYTSRYFASKTITTLKTSTRFLSNYTPKIGSKNPKLFSKRTMNLAINNFIEGHPKMYSPETIEELREKNRADEELIEKQRANIEDNIDEDSVLAFLNGESEDTTTLRESKRIRREVNERAKVDFPKVALQHLLGISGYTFNFEQYKKDLYTDISHEEYREPGQSRSAVQRDARKRLASSTAYLVKIDGLK